ncbi:MAG: Uma2 family endonuclease [Thermostichus sp. DRC_bins_24]
MIEILSPEQSSNRVTGNILHCLRHGCCLGWLIDPEDCSVMIFQPDRLPDLLRDGQRLVVLQDIPLMLTAEDVFG